MFESDQHEFDEGFDELGHVSPPPPLAKANPVPVATAAEIRQAIAEMPAPPSAPAMAPAGAGAPAPATSATESVGRSAPVKNATSVAVAEPMEEEEGYEEYEQEPEEFTDPAEHSLQELPQAPQKKPIPIWLIGGFAALILFAVFVVYTATKPKDNAPPPGDMGPGIVAASGLRGHLTTRWDGGRKDGKLVYQLHVEPMEDRWQEGFSRAVLEPPQPLLINIRLLDATGFALCGKEIPFHFNPQNVRVQVPATPLIGPNGKKLTATERNAAYQSARQNVIAQMQTAAAARENGKDVFQSQTGPDGLVTAANVQGTLPCSPDQYQKASYWDMNTNFPTLDEQAALLDPRAAAQQARESSDPGASRARKRVNYRPTTGFVIQGDDRVTEYDSARGQLWTHGKTFQIDRMVGQATAMAWANNNTLVHYSCDQQANCALTAPGGSAVLHARLN